jgi:16S rRNA U1498 N3-methylase RsmE
MFLAKKDSGNVIRAMSSLFSSVLRTATANCAILSLLKLSKPVGI